MSDLEDSTGQPPETQTDPALVPPPPDAPPTAVATDQLPEPDPRDARIAELEAQNLALRSQVADLLAQIDQVTREQGPQAPPTGETTAGPSSPSGFDVAARAQELERQGVPEADAAEQATYEQRLWNDRQNAQG